MRFRQRAETRASAARLLGLFGARSTSTALNGVSLILLARWLGPTEFGSFSVAWAMASAISGVLGLGLHVFALRAAVRGEREATGYALFLNLCASGLAFIVGGSLIVLATALPPWAAWALALSVAVERNAEVRIALGTEFGRARTVNYTLLARGAGLLAIMTAGWWIGVHPLESYLVGRLVLMSASAWWLMHRVRGWSLVFVRPRDGSLSTLMPIAASAVAAAARTLDVPIVGAVAGPVGAGLYSAAQKVMMPVFLVAQSLKIVLLGPVARGGADRARRGVGLLMITWLVTTVVAGVASIWADPIAVLILGREFADAGGVLRWFLLSAPAIAVAGLIGTVLQDKGRARSVAVITAVAMILLLSATALGAHIAGAEGATAGGAVAAWAHVVAVWALATRALRSSESARGTCGTGTLEPPRPMTPSVRETGGIGDRERTSC